MFALAGV